MTRHRLAFRLVIAVVCAWAGAASSVHAYDEQASLDVSAGYLGAASAETLETHGAILDVGAGVGLTDLFVLRGAAGYAPRFADGDVRHAVRVRAEGAYLIDVLRWVPFFGLGAQLWAYDDGESFLVRPGGHALVGLDFLASRTWVIGLDLRQGVLWEKGSVASLTEGQLRLSRMFELF